MTDDRLTPEERAVLGAADALYVAAVRHDESRCYSGHGKDADFVAAIAAYRKSIAPPEPFERYVFRWSDGTWGTEMYDKPPNDRPTFWRCTITPVERVR